MRKIYFSAVIHIALLILVGILLLFRFEYDDDFFPILWNAYNTVILTYFTTQTAQDVADGKDKHFKDVSEIIKIIVALIGFAFVGISAFGPADKFNVFITQLVMILPAYGISFAISHRQTTPVNDSDSGTDGLP